VKKTEADPPETQRLLEQAEAGCRQALDELFAGHRSYLRRVVERCLDLRLRGRVDASDVVQETQLEALRRMPGFLRRRPMPFRLWLWKTAYERTLVLRRRHLGAARRTVNREVALPGPSSPALTRAFAAEPTPSEQLSRCELSEQLRAALERLAAADREVLCLRAVDGLSNQEIGARLGLDPATVSKRYGRALVRLHRVLAGESGRGAGG
jgi:RNA polymerase sigma-70 factor (ECF subfamily)